jgi:hypothetical protein
VDGGPPDQERGDLGCEVCRTLGYICKFLQYI